MISQVFQAGCIPGWCQVSASDYRECNHESIRDGWLPLVVHSRCFDGVLVRRSAKPLKYSTLAIMLIFVPSVSSHTATIISRQHHKQLPTTYTKVLLGVCSHPVAMRSLQQDDSGPDSTHFVSPCTIHFVLNAVTNSFYVIHIDCDIIKSLCLDCPPSVSTTMRCSGSRNTSRCTLVTIERLSPCPPLYTVPNVNLRYALKLMSRTNRADTDEEIISE